ncbi:MAG: hypothetical protein ACI9UK_000070 [Candidatus Krumholzibacteriia bacterium]
MLIIAAIGRDVLQRNFALSVLTAIVLIVSGAGCGLSEEKSILMAAGAYGDLAVVVSDDAMKPMASQFVGRFNTEHLFVIKPEMNFKTDIFGPQKLKFAHGYKNALMLVHLGAGGRVEKEAKKQISKETWERLNAGGGGVVQVKDPWSTYQLLVVVASRDRNSVASLLNKNLDKIQDLFDNSNRERILRRNRYDGLKTDLMDLYRRDIGFYLEIPGEYEQNQYRPDGFPGLELMRKGPSRGISVSWMDSKNPVRDLANFEIMARMRAKMGTRLHNEEIIESTFVWDEIEINGVLSVSLKGAWNSRRFAGGGPFWCYFVPDVERGRIYCVDMLAFAPGMEKMNFFRRMSAVVSTFSLKGPQS